MKLFTNLSISAALLGALTVAAVAGPPASKAKAAATMTCPACKMPMPTKKTAVYSVPIKIKGVTYYCCSACPAGKAAAAKNAKAKPAPAK